jgi:hypothetical protein
MLALDEVLRLDMLGVCIDDLLVKLLLLSSLSATSPAMTAESRESHCEHNVCGKVIPGVLDEADEEVASPFGKVRSRLESRSLSSRIA